MKATFQVRDRAYEATISRVEKPEGEKLELYDVRILVPGSGPVHGTLKLTAAALQVARERADKESVTPEDVLARGCARSLAAEVLIRKLKPDFSFVVDHRWMER